MRGSYPNKNQRGYQYIPIKYLGLLGGDKIFTKVCDTRAVMAEYYPRCREIENIIARGYHSTATTTTDLKYPVM